ncbi:serine/threonine-protein phosphatase 4 regulatory subunit 2-A-like isoform X2 [Chenopodium quinoa]|uniref:serine/threonine-protein phosphatase 4 regulatory subunit 2-A-like isoform X2 n=1 Tax=Chenopodium quinoa TaxID=63459 RepID=UPI000B778428|nr:serine/threonine-protein phosphatase 4 regulatory subunit 2-A-like isoform X2 [Chenopodium quinoa]
MSGENYENGPFLPVPEAATPPALAQGEASPQLSDANGNGESDPRLSAEEVKGVLEIIASTGKFWHEWDELKNMLLFQLKQILSEYPEAKIPDDQQNSSLGESYTQLVKSLEEALFSFLDGPPFTLQRLCEILLDAQTIYPNLSKLALALEKNLLVTSTLTKSTDSYPPPIVQLADASREQVEDAQPQPQPLPLPEPQPETESQPEPQPQSPPQSNSVENGGEPMTGDRDEVMSEVDAEVDDGMTIDMETFEEIISSSETNSQPNNSQSKS